MFCLYVGGKLAGDYENFGEVQAHLLRLLGREVTYSERMTLLNGRTVQTGSFSIQLLADDAVLV